jgi:DNA mismatch endonuclease, patch repair protein
MERVLREKLDKGSFGHLSLERSRLMAAIKGRGNKSTEVRFRLALVRRGIRGWSLHPKTITGKPDFFFHNQRVAVFVDGCFWHGCRSCGHIPKNNQAFWAEKIRRTKIRDKKRTSILKQSGIIVLRFWEHDLTTALEDCIQDVESILAQADASGSIVQEIALTVRS